MLAFSPIDGRDAKPGPGFRRRADHGGQNHGSLGREGRQDESPRPSENIAGELCQLLYIIVSNIDVGTSREIPWILLLLACLIACLLDHLVPPHLPRPCQVQTTKARPLLR